MQQSADLARAVGKRIKRLLKGRDLRFLAGKPTSTLRHEQVQVGEPDGNTEHEPSSRMAATLCHTQQECTVPPAVVSLAQGCRGLNTADLKFSTDTCFQEPPLRSSVHDCEVGLSSSAVHGARLLQGEASTLRRREQSKPQSSCGTGQGGAAGLASNLQEPAAQDRGRAEAWLADASSESDRQWAVRVVASLGDISTKYAKAPKFHRTCGASSRASKALGNDNVGEAAVNKTPSWEFALQQLEGRGSKLTRAGTHTACVPELCCSRPAPDSSRSSGNGGCNSVMAMTTEAMESNKCPKPLCQWFH